MKRYAHLIKVNRNKVKTVSVKQRHLFTSSEV